MAVAGPAVVVEAAARAAVAPASVAPENAWWAIEKAASARPAAARGPVAAPVLAVAAASGIAV
ncbi:hypothetical protein AWB95_10855 [Mycobacterium celatum]|uniref:Uncharacterized protein n=1 Tax=Mycobacterium celatum TaxID=28045 RepID=A0A1X1RS32_MYCCE|nr:hypothetical protein AWB95_10855 [Mycobacterium celatum]